MKFQFDRIRAAKAVSKLTVDNVVNDSIVR